nr:MFS transporter [Demequina sp. TTPB684]
MAWLVFATAAAAYFVAVVHRTALGVAGVEALDRFGIEATALSLLAVLQIAVYAAMQVPAGNLLDRYGPAAVIAVGSLVMALGQAMMAFAPNFGWALAARVLIGAGDAPVFIAATRLVAHHFPARRVPLMVQVTGLIGQSGQLATAIPLAFVLHWAGWTAALGSLAIVGAMTAAAVWWLLIRPRDASFSPERSSSISVRAAMTTSMRTAGVRLGFWSHFVGPFSANTIALLWGYPYFTTAQGRSPAEGSLLLTAMVIAIIAAAPVIGALTARHPLRRSWLVIGGAVITALAWVAILVPTTPRPLWQLIVFVCVVGAGGPMSLVGMDFARTFAVSGRLGSATGFVNMGGFISTIISVLLVGVVLQAVSPAGSSEYSLAEYRVAFAALAVPWLVGIAGVVGSRRDTRAVMASDGLLVPSIREVWRRRRDR